MSALSTPEQYTETELDDVEVELDELLEEVNDAYVCVNEVSTLSTLALDLLPSPFDQEFAARLASARDELEDALALIEETKRRSLGAPAA